MSRHEQANSFGAAADVYERARPSYPDEAVDWLLPSGAPTVLDLGAGTGKLTRVLVQRGLEVTAVEPLQGMREQLERALPDVPCIAGTGESIPLPDGSFDVVLAAQAWHWVDPAVAAPEVARVLRPGGWLGLVWNVRDETVDWVAELGRIMQQGQPDLTHSATEGTDVGPPFGDVEQTTFRWAAPMTSDAVLDLVRSRSYFITAPPERQGRVLAEVRSLLAGRDQVELPYETRCFRTDLS